MAVATAATSDAAAEAGASEDEDIGGRNGEAESVAE